MTPRALAVLAAVLFALLPRLARAESALEVVTAIDDVRACAVGEGVVLAGTTGGMAIYGSDGKLARVMTSLDALPDTRVHALLLEGQTLWIGTERGLVEGRVDGARVSILRAFPSQAVRALHRHGGALYVGTWGGGVLRMGRSPALETVPFTAARGVEQTRVTSLATWGADLVAGTGAGLVRQSKSGMAPYDSARVPSSIWSLATHGDRLWVGSLEGTVSIPLNGPARFESDADARALASTADGVLIGTYGKGLLRTSAHGTEALDLPGNAFVQAVDARGARCVGTRAGLVVGSTRIHGGGLPENDITAIARDGDRLWVGTYEHGVAVLEAGSWRRIPHVDGRVNALALEGRRAWIATARGLTMIDGDTTRTYGGGGVLPSSAVHAVTALTSGGVLVGTERGAAVIRDGAVVRIDDKQGVPLRAVWAVAEAPGGVLLLGTSAGLYAGPLGGPWQRASIVSGHLKDDWITALAVSGHDVYVGTYNAGVTRLVLEEKLTVGEHLGGGYVNPAGLAIAGGALYAGTMDGLLARPIAGGGWRTLAGASTGKDVTGVIASGPDLWVSSRRGLARVRR